MEASNRSKGKANTEKPIIPSFGGSSTCVSTWLGPSRPLLEIRGLGTQPKVGAVLSPKKICGGVGVGGGVGVVGGVRGGFQGKSLEETVLSSGNRGLK